MKGGTDPGDEPMEVERVRSKRSEKFISRKIQFRFAFTVVPYMLLYTLAAALAVLAPFVIKLFWGVSLEEQERVVSLFLTLYQNLWAVAAFSLILIASHSILMAHKMAGPIRKFEETLRALETWDVPDQLKLRKDDYFRELEGSWNELLKSLKGDVEFLLDRSSRCVNWATRLSEKQASGSLTDRELREGLEAIRSSQADIINRYVWRHREGA